MSESVPEEVRKWLASTFAKQEQVIKMMIKLTLIVMTKIVAMMIRIRERVVTAPTSGKGWLARSKQKVWTWRVPLSSSITSIRNV